MENHFPYATNTGINYPPQWAYNHHQQSPFNYQPQSVLLPQVQIEQMILLNRLLHSYHSHQPIVQNISLLQQQYQLKQTPNVLKMNSTVDLNDTRNRFVPQTVEVAKPPQRNTIDPPITAPASNEGQENQEIAPTPPTIDLPQQRVRKTKREFMESHKNSISAPDSSNKEPTAPYSALTNISRDSYISAAVSENKKSDVSWADDIIEDIDDINLNEIEPASTFRVVALNVRYPPAKLPPKFEKKIIGEIELVTVCELLNPLKFWIHLTSQYNVLTEIMERLE